MKYKVGDKVKVRDDLETFRMYGKYEFEEEMEIHKGKEATIIGVYKDNYDLNIDNDGFYWTDEMLKPIAKSIAESDENTDKVSTNSVESIDNFSFKDLKFGDIVTVRNGYKYIYIPQKNKLFNSNGTGFICLNDINDLLECMGNSSLDIIKVQRIDSTFIGECFNLEDDKTKIRAIETIYERKEEILDEEEKEYLSAVVKPFRDKVEYVKKHAYIARNEEYIMISVENDTINFPNFEENTMYKGMELNKTYKLEELGI